MRPYIFVVLALALVSFKPTTSRSATKLTIGHSTINPRIAPLWIAQEKGYFQKYGIDATLVFVRNTPLMIAAMKLEPFQSLTVAAAVSWARRLPSRTCKSWRRLPVE
jgi:ABC-type nitrate/sulfonate/bicarbonate transport system substrate-binding protein